jgi:hypothetical protein
MMKSKHFVPLLAILAFALPIRPFAQEAKQDAPTLTLDEAVSFALANNRLVKNSVLEAQKYDFQVSTMRSKRLPHFQFSVLGGELLQPFDFTFAKGVFGTYPGTGPIPSTDAKVHTPARLTAFVNGSIDQPLTQQYKIGLDSGRCGRSTGRGQDAARGTASYAALCRRKDGTQGG